jgi:tetratricopeptide (TPR) repeat protein
MLVTLVAFCAVGSLEAEALRASGYDDVEPARRRLGEALAFADALRSEPASPDDTGEAILTHLHRDVLRHYEPSATTLRDVLEDGRFNCVSSALLFNLAAARAGLITRGELHPTHARSQVRVNGRWVVVETTSAAGFDPSREDLARIMGQLAGFEEDAQPGLVRAGGERVDDRGLVAAMWANRGILAQRSGDGVLAERLFRESERKASSPTLRRALTRQRAALLIQLGVDEMRSGDPRRGLDSLRTVFEFEDLDPSFEQLLARNYEAAAQRYVALQTVQGVDAFLASLGDPVPLPLRRTVRVHARLRQAQIHVDARRWQDAVLAFERAASAGARSRSEVAEQNLTQARVPWAQALALTGNLDRALRVGGPGADRVSLFMLAGGRHLERGEFDRAIEVYARCLQEAPDPVGCRNNYAVALQRRVRPDLDAGRCDAAAPWLARLAEVDPEFSAQATYVCEMKRALQSYQRSEFSAALDRLIAAARTGREPTRTRRNVEAVLNAWARAAAPQGRCEAVRRAASRVRAEVPRLEFQTDLGKCAR